jgi:hypothetical protein
MDGSWTAPVSLGPLINDGVAHRWGEGEVGSVVEEVEGGGAMTFL